MSGRDFSSVKLPKLTWETGRIKYSREQEAQYWEAKAQYGDDECIHVLSDLWGSSTHQVKRIIEEISSSWL